MCVKICKVCGREFLPRTHRQAYCSEGCGAMGRRDNRRRAAERKKRKAAAPAVSVDEVLRFAGRYAAVTGHYPHYGEAVRLLEQEAAG